MATSTPLIHSDPEILGGTPVFVGTRVLRRCAGRFDALVTMDSSLEFQQRVSNRPFDVIVIQA